MEVILNRDEIDDAIALANITFARWKNQRGFYPNEYNSHIKGKLGEIAVEKALKSEDVAHTSHFRNAKSQGLCDIELANAQYARLDVKIWSLEHWPDQGRCVTPGQLPKLQSLADAVVWCIVDLPKINTASDLDSLIELLIDIRGWSTVDEVAATTPGPTGWRKIINHQVDETALRSPTTLFASFRSNGSE
jgi:hypothetical protein